MRGCHGRDPMVVGFITTYPNQFRQGVLNTTLCDRVCQWLATSRWFSADTLVSSINKIDCHDIIEILLKMALNTITLLNLTLYFLERKTISKCISEKFIHTDQIIHQTGILWLVNLPVAFSFGKNTPNYGSDLKVYAPWVSCMF